MTGLDLKDLSSDPIDQFRTWFEEARRHPEIAFPETACLSTLGPDQTPEGRMVLVKGFDHRGFAFFTNLESHKARSLREHPRAGLTFHWIPLGRQIRLRGPVEPVADAEADAYFATRPRGSQLGAWASDQSRELESREALEARVRDVEGRFEGLDVARPPHWSGFRIVPVTLEFWQEGAFRLHDRFVFRRDGEGWAPPARLFP